MKKILIAIAAVGILFSGCRSQREMAQSPYTTDTTTEPKVFSVPTSDTETTTVETTAAEVQEPIDVRTEQVTFTSQDDRLENDLNTYFVIIGSFSQLENARNYRETLTGQGFTPIILHSETGYYRVCVNSYENETESRSRIAQIRQAFPQYSDVWLLIKE